MKRLFCLCLALALFLSACAYSDRAHPDRKVEFFYRSADDAHFSTSGIMASETRILQWEKQNIPQLMKLYLGGNTSAGLIDPFPKGMQLLDVQQSNDTLTLVFDSMLANLQGIRLRVAASCIAQTLFSFGGYDCVTLCAQTEQGKPVMLDGQECIVVFPEALVLDDCSVGMKEMPVRLYFADSEARYLVPEMRGIDPENAADMPKQLLSALITGPKTASSRPTIPNDTMLLHADITDKVCVVDFSSEFLRGFSDNPLAARLRVFSVVATLTQLDEVDTVEIKVDGSMIPADLWPDSTRELVLDERMIGSPKPNSGAYDATLYLLQEGHNAPVPFPLRIPQPVDGNLAQALCHALFAFAPRNGYYSPLQNTDEPECEQRGDAVWVSLPPELLTKGGDERDIMVLQECLRATFLGLPGVQAVHFSSIGNGLIECN